MAEAKSKPLRIFGNKPFMRFARGFISPERLWSSLQGAPDADLGGGVFKKRLNKNRHRSLILARGRTYWVYAYLFAKQDRANIDADELKAFRDLADLYAAKSPDDIAKEIAGKELVEICHAQKA